MNILLHSMFQLLVTVTSFLARWFLTTWWQRRYVPPKRWLLQQPHGVISQKTAFFIVTSMKTSDLQCLLIAVCYWVRKDGQTQSMCYPRRKVCYVKQFGVPPHQQENGKGNVWPWIGYRVLVHKGIISAFEGVEFVSDRMWYIILGG
jgi:hypothetical protein